MASLTHQRLLEVLAYEPETGLFRWRHAGRGRPHAGAIAGNGSHSGGYWRIHIDYKLYFAHRLAWLYVHGDWPPEEIDHIDGNRSNNAIANLRPATSSQNHCNAGKKSRNTSGFKGVSWHKARGKWRTCIRAGGRNLYLGSFSSAEEAAEAYAAAAKRLHGEFANTGAAP